MLSRRKQEVQVPERRGSARINKETGEYEYKESGRTYINSKGQRVKAMQNVPLISTVDDMRKLSSGTPQENAYADYGNTMKALARKARKEAANTPPLKYSATANKAYKTEVDDLLRSLSIAERNAPKERRAQAIANSVVKAKIQDNPELGDKANKKELEKVRSAAIDDARASVGASGRNTRIHITDKQWQAIQSGAISDTRLRRILRYTDEDELKALAMPKTNKGLSTAQQNKMKRMKTSGYTIAEIADALGVSTGTVSKYINA